ncbi:unnamed protein product [Caenorhabditis brenneri]
MKTQKPISTTTVDPYQNYDDDFIYSDPFGNGYKDNNDFFVSEEFLLSLVDIIETLRKIYSVAAFVNLFVNIPHLFILTRKELRSNLVYIIMIGICICDFIHSIGNIAQQTMHWQIFYKTQECYGVFPYKHIMTDIIGKCTQIMSRRCSSILALFIATFRAFSVMFPMSNAVNFLMKAKSGYLIVLFTMVGSAAWSSQYYFKTIYYKFTMCPVGRTPSWVMYHQDTLGPAETKIRIIDGSMAIIISCLYVLVAIALVVALAQAKKRSKNLRNDKSRSTNTSALVSAMAFLIFISEMTYGIIFLASYFVFEHFMDRGYVTNFEVFAMTLSIINSVAHCFICYSMSSQYRDVVKGLIWCVKEKDVNVKVAIVESSAHPSTVDTGRTSKSSKKSY